MRITSSMITELTEYELVTILNMEKWKKQSKEIADGFLSCVDIKKALEKGIVDSYTSPKKCVLCTV